MRSGDGGAGIYNYDLLSISSSDLSGNISFDSGGAIDDLGISTVTNSTLSDNSAVSYGGAISSSDLTLSDSTLSWNTVSPGSAGAIEVFGLATVTDCTITDNTAPGNESVYSEGGAIAVDEGGGDLTLSGSTISGNSATLGGAFTIFGMAIISDSTVSDNTASRWGGAIYSGGSVLTEYSTISGNSATLEGGAIDVIQDGGAEEIADTIYGNSAETGGGIFNEKGGDVVFAATIVAGSSAGGDCVGSIDDEGYNLDDDGTCAALTTDHGISDENPDLGPLADNGGPTETQAPSPASPVIDAIPVGAMYQSTPLCTGTDQRGVARPQGSGCDIGSYEYGDVAMQSLTASAKKVAHDSDVAYNATVVNAGSASATGVTVTDTIPIGEKFKSAMASLGSCTKLGATVTCTIGNMGPATTTTARIVVKVTATSGKIEDTATVSAMTEDTIPGNDSQSVKVKVK